MNKKILILSVADLRHMTAAGYFYYYLNYNNLEFDIVCTDRYDDHSADQYPYNIYSYKWISTTHQPKIKKIIPMLRFRKYALDKIKKNKYLYIIVWGENAGILFGSYLRKKYKGNYCINIRDIDIFKTLKISWCLNLIEKYTLKYAQFYTTPAPGGLFFKHKNALILLNRDYITLEKCEVRKRFKEVEKSPIVITYMGLINQYYEFFIKIVKTFANDERFLLRFYGEGSEKIDQYVIEKKINNIETKGAFSANETFQYLNETDIIFSAYGRTNYGVTDAIGVKESYGPQLRIPVISDNYGIWYDIACKYGFGYGIDESNIDKLPNDLFDWYCELDFKIFEKGCIEYCNIVEKNNRKVWRLLDRKIMDK